MAEIKKRNKPLPKGRRARKVYCTCGHSFLTKVLSPTCSKCGGRAYDRKR